MNLKELQARLDDAKLRGQALLTKNEGREITDEDLAVLDKIKGEVDKYKKLIDTAKELTDDEPKPKDKDKSDDNSDDKDDDAPKDDPSKSDRSFRSLGDQMMVVAWVFKG